jgi:hypothetical protein
VLDEHDALGTSVVGEADEQRDQRDQPDQPGRPDRQPLGAGRQLVGRQQSRSVARLVDRGAGRLGAA